MLTLKNPETQNQNGCSDFLNALPGKIRALLSDCIILYLADSVEIYVPTKIIEKRLCKQALSIYRQASHFLGVSEMTIVSDNGRFTVDRATADFFQTSTQTQKIMTYTIANATLTPSERLQANYGERLDALTTEAVLEAITLIGLCLCNESQPSRIINCGGFYSNLLSFHTFALVVCDDSLTRVDLMSLLRYLSESL